MSCIVFFLLEIELTDGHRDEKRNGNRVRYRDKNWDAEWNGHRDANKNRHMAGQSDENRNVRKEENRV